MDTRAERTSAGVLGADALEEERPLPEERLRGLGERREGQHTEKPHNIGTPRPHRPATHRPTLSRRRLCDKRPIMVEPEPAAGESGPSMIFGGQRNDGNTRREE